MEINNEKLDEVVLALLYLTAFNENDYYRAWKGHDWDTLNRLFEKGFFGFIVPSIKKYFRFRLTFRINIYDQVNHLMPSHSG